MSRVCLSPLASPGALLWCTSLVVLACDDPLRDPALIDRPRALAARVEVVGDATRATPRVGESVRVRWLLLGPNGPLSVAGELHACVDADVSSGVPRCEGAAYTRAVVARPVVAQPAPPASTEPVATFTVPVAGRLLVRGAFCEAGRPVLPAGFDADDYLAARCDSGAVPLLVSSTIDVAVDQESVNRNPDATTLQRSLSGVRIAAVLSPCSDGTSLKSGTTALVRLTVPEALAEPGESLLVQHLTSAGKLQRAWSTPGPGDRELTLELTAPTVAVATELSLTQVVRDGRGGVSWVTDQLCVVP